jgi:hypothetical protein
LVDGAALVQERRQPCNERVGLVTNGVELRLLISDPARPDSQVIIKVDPGWKRSLSVPRASPL